MKAKKLYPLKLQFGLTQEQHNKLTTLAEMHNCSMGEILRQLISDASVEPAPNIDKS